MMVIGTKSGKEFMVDDKNYTLTNDVTGEATHIFTTSNRIITIHHTDIEFWDETKTLERIKKLDVMATKGRPMVQPLSEVDVT